MSQSTVSNTLLGALQRSQLALAPIGTCVFSETKAHLLRRQIVMDSPECYRLRSWLRSIHKLWSHIPLNKERGSRALAECLAHAESWSQAVFCKRILMLALAYDSHPDSHPDLHADIPALMRLDFLSARYPICWRLLAARHQLPDPQASGYWVPDSLSLARRRFASTSIAAIRPGCWPARR